MKMVKLWYSRSIKTLLFYDSTNSLYLNEYDFGSDKNSATIIHPKWGLTLMPPSYLLFMDVLVLVWLFEVIVLCLGSRKDFFRSKGRRAGRVKEEKNTLFVLFGFFFSFS